MIKLATRPLVGRTIAVAIVATGSVVAPSPAGAAIPDGAVTAYQRCIFGAPISADAHEAWALRCRARTVGLAP